MDYLFTLSAHYTNKLMFTLLLCNVISMAEQNVGTVLNRNEESLTKTNEITPGLSGAQIKSNSIEFEN